MFTGLVETLGSVDAIEAEPPGKRLVVRAGLVADGARVGDSIAINGCCLTIISVDGGLLAFQAGPETLARTNLGQLKSGSSVNLERSLKLGDRLGGHLVTGHIDAIGQLVRRQDDRDWSTFWFMAPEALAPQIAQKGSIAVDGVSLTVVEATRDEFSVALIPHTLSVTTLGQLKIGYAVNLETDLLAKYVARQRAFEL